MKKIASFICALVLMVSLASECFAANAMAAPQLKQTTCYGEGGKICCTLEFQTQKGAKYRVYRRTPNTKKYTKLKDVTAKGNSYSFQDKSVKKGSIYYYTVRRILSAGNLSDYNVGGIKGICFDTNAQIVLTTLSAKVTFKTTPEASSYTVFRKTDNTAWRAIKTYGASSAKTICFTDMYYRTLTTAAEKKYLLKNSYIDPSENPFRYEVRACFSAKNGAKSLGYYAKEGNCVLPEPVLCEVKTDGKSASFVWSGVPVAKSFNLYAKTSKNASWQKLKVIKNDREKLQRASVKLDKNYRYFTVRAFANVRGSIKGSGFEKNFTILHRCYQNQKALFLGDSFAIGRPYNGERLRYYPYSKRVEQLLGMKCDNVSITASTFCNRYEIDAKQSIWSDQLQPMSEGKAPNTPAGFDKPQNLARLWQYDYVVIAGGINDHAISAPLGESDSTDIATVNGALNHIKHTIRLMNKVRREHGKADVRVIVLEIAFSNRVGSDFTSIRNRMKTKNALSITLEEYKNSIVSSFSDGFADVKFIPSEYILNEKNCSYVSADNLHYTKNGYALLGNTIASMMMNW